MARAYTDAPLAKVMHDAKPRVLALIILKIAERLIRDPRDRRLDPTRFSIDPRWISTGKQSTSEWNSRRWWAALGLSLLASLILLLMGVLVAALLQLFGAEIGRSIRPPKAEWWRTAALYGLIAFGMFAPWVSFSYSSMSFGKIHHFVNGDYHPQNQVVAQAFLLIRNPSLQLLASLPVAASSVAYGFGHLGGQPGTSWIQVVGYGALGFLGANSIWWIVLQALLVARIAFLKGLRVRRYNPARTPGIQSIGTGFVWAGVMTIVAAALALAVLNVDATRAAPPVGTEQTSYAPLPPTVPMCSAASPDDPTCSRQSDNGLNGAKQLYLVTLLGTVCIVWAVPQLSLVHIIRIHKNSQLSALGSGDSAVECVGLPDTDTTSSWMVYNSVDSTPNSAVRLTEGFAGLVTILVACYGILGNADLF